MAGLEAASLDVDLMNQFAAGDLTAEQAIENALVVRPVDS